MTESVKREIGIVVASLHENVQSLIWPGIEEYATANNIRLITYVATSQDQITSLDLHYKIVKDFIMNNSNLDGLIVFSGAMGEHLTVQEVNDFCSNLGSMPIVTIAMETPSSNTSILVENKSGVIDLVKHFNKVHGKHRIAYIRGPEGHEEAEERFNAYKEGLEICGIEFDPELVFPGEFSDDSGSDAVKKLLENKTDFDSIITADDETAFGAMEELKRQSVSIPADIPIGGFDDVTESSFVLPSLTTVRQPLYKQGNIAIKTLISILDGDKPQKIIKLPTESVYRRSCGCFSESIKPVELASENIRLSSDDNFLQNKIFDIITDYYGSTPLADKLISITKGIVELFIQDVASDEITNNFLTQLDKILFELSLNNKFFEAVEDIISQFYLAVTLIEDKATLLRAANLIQQSRTLLSEYLIRQTQAQNIKDASIQLEIRETSQKLITTFELNRLLVVMKEEFPELGIKSFFFSLYDSREIFIPIEQWEYPKRSNLLLGYSDDKGFVANKLNCKKESFDSYQLHPLEMFNSVNNIIYMPLFFKNEHFGFVCFEHSKDIPFFIYEELRLHISSALKSSFMLEELKAQSLHDELTTLYNRRGFMSIGKKMVKSAKNSSLELRMFYIDLDGLKTINDTYGHDEGDIAIRATGQILSETFRRQDIVGRMGGDEFTVLIAADKNIDSEKLVTERLQNKIKTYNNRVKKPYELSMSIGSAVFKEFTDAEFELVMKKADDILMERKKFKKGARRGIA